MRLPRQVAPWLLALERTVQELELELPLQSLVQVTLCSSTCRSWERHHWQARQRVMALQPAQVQLTRRRHKLSAQCNLLLGMAPLRWDVAMSEAGQSLLELQPAWSREPLGERKPRSLQTEPSRMPLPVSGGISLNT